MAIEHSSAAEPRSTALPASAAEQPDSNAALAAFLQQLRATVSPATHLRTWLGSIHSLYAEFTGGTLLAWSTKCGSNPNTQVVIEGIAVPLQNIPEIARSQIEAIAEQCWQKNEVQVRPRILGGESVLVAVPSVTAANFSYQALIAIGDGRTNAARLRAGLEAIALCIHGFPSGEENPNANSASHAAAITDLVARICGAGSVSEAAHALAGEAAPYLKSREVLVGFKAPADDRCRLVAVSGVSDFDPRSELSQHRECLLDEAIVRDAVSVWPSLSFTDRPSLIMSEFAIREGAEWIVTGPLKTAAGHAVGAWAAVGAASDGSLQETGRFFRAAVVPVGEAVHLQQRSAAGLIQRVIRRFWPESPSRRRRLTITLFLLVAVTPFLPIPNLIRGAVELQPLRRRFVAAPFDAALEEALVKPGDLVHSQDVLARLDGREVRWELAGIEAEYSRAEKQRDAHLAAKSLGPASVARLEMDQLHLQQQLWEHRRDHLEIRSPIDGIVVSGDLKRTEGVPLKTGQTLFEIAPLEEMLVELAVIEDDLPQLRPGMPILLHLDGSSISTLQGTILRIRPRSERREDRYVFVAEVELANPDGLLRPGMHGQYTVNAGICSLGWKILHKPLRHFIYWWGW